MNARLVIVCVLFLAIFIDSGSAPVYCQQKKPTDKLVIAISSDFKPYSFLNSTGKPAGLFVDFWQLWSQKTGNKIEFIVSDWKTSVENLKSGKADIHSGLASSPERAAWISLTKKLYEVDTALFYPIRSGKRRDITSFYGKTIAAVKGTKTEKFLSLNHPEIQIISCPNRLELLKVTQEGKAAGFVAFEMVGKNLINDQGLSGEFAVLDSVFEKENLYPSIRKENIELSARIDKSFGQLSNAELAEIEARWIPEENKRFYRTNTAVEFSPAERAWLDRRLTVRVRVGDSPPYQMTTPEPQGISVDYLKLIGKRLGINFVFVTNRSLNWEMSLEDLAGERQWLDLIVAIKRTPEREKVFALTDDYLSSPWVIINRTDSSFISRIQDLAGKKVAVEKGFVVKDLIEKEYPQIKTVLFTTSYEALLSVASGLSDAYVANLAIASYIIKDKGLANLRIAAPTPFGSHDQAMGVRKDWPELASIINKALKAMSDAEESEIRDRWLSIRYEFGIRSKEVWSWIGGLTTAFLLVIAVTLIWNRRLKREIDRRVKAEEAIVREITERREMENALQKQASILSGVLESTGSAVFSIDSSYRYTSFNSAHAKTMKALYNTDIQLGTSIIDVMTNEDAAVARVNLDRALAGEAFVIEASSGDTNLERSVFEVSHNPINNSEGRAVGVTVLARDISERRKNEEKYREMQSQLMQQDKMATIGQLAAGVAHEINNPLGFVVSNMSTFGKYIEKYNLYIDTVEQELRAGDSGILPEKIQTLRQSLKLGYIINDINVLIDENNEGLERVNRIVQDLQTFSRSDASVYSNTDLNQCLDSTINIISNVIRYAAELRREFSDLPKIFCNSQQINQVFMNLLMNAAHAIQTKGEEVGTITIRTWSDHYNVFVSVSDTGCGIAPENRNKIFDAFYTTKEVGKGTGLGLSISASIVNNHGGDITVESEVGVGSTFTVRLPLKQ